jgi:hypothetical protein
MLLSPSMDVSRVSARESLNKRTTVAIEDRRRIMLEDAYNGFHVKHLLYYIMWLSVLSTGM